MIEVKEHAGLIACVALVHQRSASPQEIAVAFQGEVDCGIQQWVAGTYECSEHLALRRDKGFLEDDALVAREHWLADTDQTVAVTHRRGYVGHFVPARLPLLG